LTGAEAARRLFGRWEWPGSQQNHRRRRRANVFTSILIFDHLQFRTKMKAAGVPKSLTLAKPTALSGMQPWFDRFYVAGSRAERDRQLFSH
jgi:hypothetical protein